MIIKPFCLNDSGAKAKDYQILDVAAAPLLVELNYLQESCNRCPPGWNLFTSTCYYYSQHDPGFRKNWNDSRADCIKQGGDLVVINSFQEQVGRKHGEDSLRRL
uniref:C-type lectin domain-containing protein n=1 Tax=Gouania willdenowi TaxID=441366 RepID=A0A8C5E5B1_GOUWI